MARVMPFVVGVIPVFLLFLLTFLSWYWLMANLFSNEMYVYGIITSYSLPVIFVLIAYISSKTKGPKITALSHFLALLILGILYASIASIVPQSKVPIFMPEAIVGIGFISAVMSVMLYPITTLEHYFAYKRLLFIAGVIFMPLFISIAAVLISPIPQLSKAVLLLLDFIGFWISAVWLSSRKTQGVYVSGLEIAPLMAFRPDLILPAGVNLVKGIIMIGIGLMIMFQTSFPFPPPFWNWWGFVVAFWGIITIIPIRGIFKMLLRRARLLGEKYAYTKQIVFARETLLFFGLLVLLYGFINAFMGTIPFTTLMPKPQTIAAGIAMIIIAYAILIIRGFYKSRFLEGTEKFQHLFTKQISLFIAILFLIYGFVTLFMGQFMIPQPSSNPIGFLIGSTLFAGGAVLILFFRPFALKNEFRAMLRIMPGMLPALSEDKRKEIMEKRLTNLAKYTDEQRFIHLKPMMEGLNDLPENDRMTVRKDMMEVLAKLSERKRKVIMSTMDKIMFRG